MRRDVITSLGKAPAHLCTYRAEPIDARHKFHQTSSTFLPVDQKELALYWVEYNEKGTYMSRGIQKAGVIHTLHDFLCKPCKKF